MKHLKVFENLNEDEKAEWIERLTKDIDKAITMYRYPQDVITTVLRNLLDRLEAKQD